MKGYQIGCFGSSLIVFSLTGPAIGGTSEELIYILSKKKNMRCCCTHTHTHTRTHARTHARTHKQMCICVCVCVCLCVRMCVDTPLDRTMIHRPEKIQRLTVHTHTCLSVFLHCGHCQSALCVLLYTAHPVRQEKPQPQVKPLCFVGSKHTHKHTHRHTH